MNKFHMEYDFVSRKWIWDISQRPFNGIKSQMRESKNERVKVCKHVIRKGET